MAATKPFGLAPAQSESPRTVHVVDVENLLGGVEFTCSDVSDLELAYRRVSMAGNRDLVVVASSHIAAAAVWFGWSNCRRLVRSGMNGADIELLAVLNEEVAGRFPKVVIGSGDVIFSPTAARLRLQGCEVTVVSRPESLSASLARVATQVRVLPGLRRPAPQIAYGRAA